MDSCKIKDLYKYMILKVQAVIKPKKAIRKAKEKNAVSMVIYDLFCLKLFLFSEFNPFFTQFYHHEVILIT